jgi:hypothetical protein
MSENRKTVFISCGQFTDDERDLGKQACELVRELTPFEGYFAQNQTTLKALSENILTRLYESVGLIVIMHHRGKIEGHEINRASVWVEQEVAIATLMEQVLRRPLHAALFVQHGITLEGLRRYIQFNANEFTTSAEVIAKLREILPIWKTPLYVGDEEKRALVEAADITAEVQIGMYLNIAILIGNHSSLDVEVKSAVFRSKGNRLCNPIIAPTTAPWKIPATRSILYQMTTDNDLSARLASVHGTFFTQNLFQAQLEIELRCEILGIGRIIKDERTVQVDIRGHQINGL